MPAKGRNPAGGLTAAGREFYRKKQGSKLKPGVKGAADTPEKMKRKGSFLTRHFTHPRGTDDEGRKANQISFERASLGRICS